MMLILLSRVSDCVGLKGSGRKSKSTKVGRQIRQEGRTGCVSVRRHPVTDLILMRSL